MRRVAAAYGPDGARALARVLRGIAAASTPRDSRDDDDSHDDDDDKDDSRDDRPGESRRTRRSRPPSPLLPAPGRVACVGTGERAACAAAALLLGRYASHAETKGTDAATALSDADVAVLLGESPFSPNHVLRGSQRRVGRYPPGGGDGVETPWGTVAWNEDAPPEPPTSPPPPTTSPRDG